MAGRFWFLFNLLCVELVHGVLDARRGERKHHLHGLVDGGLDGSLHLIGGEFAQDVLNLVSLGEVVADAEAEAWEVGVAEGFDDVVEAVMGTAAAFGAHPEPSGRQVDVVADDEDVLLRHALVIHPIADGFAAEVHISGGHGQNERTSFVLPFGDVGVPVGAEGHRQFLRQCVHHLETDVVACAGILVLSVSETEYDEFFAIFHLSKIRVQKYNFLRNPNFAIEKKKIPIFKSKIISVPLQAFSKPYCYV